jgi:hypothetical protein
MSMPVRLPLVLSLFLLCLPVAGPACADGGFPDLPKGYQLNVGDSGDMVFVELDEHAPKNRMQGAHYTYLNTSTGERRKLDVPPNFYADKAGPTARGLVLLGTEAIWPAPDEEPGRIAFVGADGKAVVGALPVTRRIPGLLVLADQSALVFGGFAKANGPRVKTVERAVLANGRIEVERLPDLPGAATAYSLVALKDGRAMLLGGSDQRYVGTCPCEAATWLLDPKTKNWTRGPSMLEARADAAATVLPDGDVLVTGGWTPGHGWQEGASRSTERWKPGAGGFVAAAPLPVGVAMHQALWSAGRQGKDLLLVGGMGRAWEGSGAVLDFETATGIWRSVGEGCFASQDNPVKAGTVVTGSVPYMWCAVSPAAPLRFVLRLPSTGPIHMPQPDGIALRRKDMAFLPVHGGGPALAVGGASNAAPTADVDAIWPDGLIEALAPLRVARTGAAVFALADGARLVAGGSGGENSPPLPAEWLAAGPAAQRQPPVVLPLTLSNGDMLGQSADGKLLALHPDGTVEAISVQAGAGGKPVVQATPLPPLVRKRRNGGEAGKVLIKGLRDGRIVIAGGEVQPYTIALLDEDSMRDDAPDRYVGAGPFEPARDVDILDRAGAAWRESAPAAGAGGTVVVLDDGRMVKLGAGTLETSTAADGAWRALEMKHAPLVKLDGQAHLFALQDELFLSGAVAGIDTGGGPAMLQWFDGARREWVTLWQADPRSNWREHLGRIVTRTLANGKHVVVPVEGS